MAHYLDPKNDLTFKRVFGEHSHLCMSLLNNMLPLEGDRKIVSLEYAPSELTPMMLGSKNSIVDVRCKDGTGRQFIVEMQMLWTNAFTSRVLFNASKAYVQQLDEGMKYRSLQPVYALSFVNEIFEPQLPDEYYHHYNIVNIRHTEKQIKGLEFVFIELPKFKPSNSGERKLHELWLRFLTEIKKGEGVIPASLLSTDETREAVQYLERGAYTESEMYAYDRYWDAIRVERDIREDSFIIGEAKGKAEGEAERLALKEQNDALATALEKEKAEREALATRLAELESRNVK